MRLYSALILYFQFINFSFCSQVIYDLKDLEILEKEKNYEEFLSHVNDIKPSERSHHWREMFQNMAIALVDYKIKTQNFSQENFKKIEQISLSSEMINDEFFQLKYSLFAKKYFNECFRKSSILIESSTKNEQKELCESEISSYWTFSKKNADVGLDLAAILEKNMTSLKLWPFYEIAIKDSIASFYCKKTTVQLAIMNKLYEETYDISFNGNYKNLINRIIPESCFNQMITPLKETLSSTKSNGLEKEMAFNILEAKVKLTQDELDLYAILYLLDGPVVGDKMNMAWKKIEGLGENFAKRQTLLGQLKQLDILPDKIFKDPNLPRHKAIINLFAKNFPEYLNYYGSNCIKYITNSGDTPLNIRSSYQCKEFLNTAATYKKDSNNKSSPWVSDSVEALYSGIKK